jgi:hypothetical protein
MRLNELLEAEADYSNFSTRMMNLGRKMFGRSQDPSMKGGSLGSSVLKPSDEYIRTYGDPRTGKKLPPRESEHLHRSVEQWQKAYDAFLDGRGKDPGPVPVSKDDLRKVNFERKRRMGGLPPIGIRTEPAVKPRVNIGRAATGPVYRPGQKANVGGVIYVWDGTQWIDPAGNNATSKIAAAIDAATRAR